LSAIRFTQTCEELDTLTISAGILEDPERFITMCREISKAKTFLTYPMHLEFLPNTNILQTTLPLWF
jgi:hypothetical protein